MKNFIEDEKVDNLSKNIKVWVLSLHWKRKTTSFEMGQRSTFEYISICFYIKDFMPTILYILSEIEG